MAFRFQPLLAMLLLLVSDAVALQSEVDADRPHKEISPPVVLYRAKDDDADNSTATDDDSSDDKPADDDAEKKDDEKKDEEKKDDEEKPAEDEAEEKPEEESTTAVPDDHVELPPASAAFFGPGGCVATFRSPSGTCIMQTRCEGAEVPETYEYGLTCVDDKGVSTRHLFGAGSFDAVETFDTLIECDLCLGVDGQKATPEMKELADDVLGLQGEMAVLKDDMKLIKDHLDIGKKDEEKKDDEKKDDEPADEKKDDAPADEKKDDAPADEKKDDAPADEDKTLFLRGKSVQKKTPVEKAPVAPAPVHVAPQKAHHAKHRAIPGKNHPIASLHSHVDMDYYH